MANPKARKNGHQYRPCGVTVPSQLITGKCHTVHNTPNKSAARTPPNRVRRCGKANPLHPISSNNPAGIPNKTPVQKKFGANAPDTKFANSVSTASTNTGGISKAAYHRPTRHLAMRANRSCTPARPATSHVTTIPDTLGPSSIAGNIKIPVNCGSASCRSRRGNATKSAPVHEIAKALRKYVATGCRPTNPRRSATVSCGCIFREPTRYTKLPPV